MMKRILIAATMSALALMAACGGNAQAANPQLIVATDGSATYGAGQALVLKKDTSSGNRVAVRYSSGWQYVKDDAVWTKYGKLVASKTGWMAVGDAVGTQVDVTLANGVVCIASQTNIGFPNANMAEVIAGDGCAFWTAVKANSN